MAITIKTESEILTTKRHLVNFSVFVPPGANPYVTAVYGETKVNNSGTILVQNNQIAVLTLNKEQLTGILVDNNSYSLPSFNSLYVGFRSMFDSLFVTNFSGLAS